MKFIHNLKVSVFCNEGENEIRIKKALLSLFPFELEKEKVKVDRIAAKGAKDNIIVILDVYLNRERLVNLFVKELVEKLTKEQKELLILQLATRIDDECNFFIRLDKDKLIKDNKMVITDKGSCFHMKFTAAAYPVNKYNAMKTVKQMLTR